MHRAENVKHDLDMIKDALRADRDRCIEDGLVNSQALADMCEDRIATLDYMLLGLARLDAIEKIINEFYADTRCDYDTALLYLGQIQKKLKAGDSYDGKR